MSTEERDEKRSALNLPLTAETVEKLQAMGKELVISEEARQRFLEAPEKFFDRAGLVPIELGETERKAVQLLADPDFQAFLSTRDYSGMKQAISRTFGDDMAMLPVAGVFDFDFDVEVTAEVVFVAVAVAVAAWVFAAKDTVIAASPEQIMERRRILARAFDRLSELPEAEMLAQRQLRQRR